MNGLLLQSEDGQDLIEILMMTNASAWKFLVEILKHFHCAWDQWLC